MHPKQSREPEGSEKGKRSIPISQPGTWSDKKPVLRFVFTFAILIALFEVALIAVFAEPVPLRRYLALNARTSAGFLGPFGYGFTSVGTVISGSNGAIEVKRGWDAVQPTVFFAAAILAFPSTWRARGLAMVSGMTVLLGLNVLRISSLFVAQVHRPHWFDTLHVSVWPMVFILVALLMWINWARCVQATA